MLTRAVSPGTAGLTGRSPQYLSRGRVAGAARAPRPPQRSWPNPANQILDHQANDSSFTAGPLLWTRFYYPSLYKAAKPADFDQYLRVMRSLLHEPGRMAALRGVATEQERCRARIPELRCPVRIVMGTRDPDFPDAVAETGQGEALIGQFTAVSLELIDGAGHYPHAELPEVTAAAILPFLADVVIA
jgi:pimeloyl-ACP methyl ester carboxylesterase